MKEDRYLAPGTKIRLDSLINDDGEVTQEYGVVVHCWFDNEIDAFDCYVAFFGNEFPSGKPKQKPYILRYAAISLTTIAA